MKVALELSRDPNVHLTVLVPRFASNEILDDIAPTSTKGKQKKAEKTDAALTSRMSLESVTPSSAKNKTDKRSWTDYFDILVLLSLLWRLILRLCGIRAKTRTRSRTNARQSVSSDKNETEMQEKKSFDNEDTLSEADADSLASGSSVRANIFLKLFSNARPNSFT